MMNFKNELENVIEQSFKELRSGSTGTRLVFPKYSGGTKMRVSEQELRFVFVELLQPLLKKYDYYYSVETPTEDKYKFSNKGTYDKLTASEDGQSASFDLTIKDSIGENIAIIEFKAKSASAHEYAKDLCKLWNPKEKSKYKYFINLFEKIEKSTEKAFCNKFISGERYNRYLSPKTSNEKVIIWAESLRDKDKTIRMEK